MNIWFDLKYTWRVLTKARGYAFLCAAVVALSVGLVTFVYSLAYGAWLKPLDIPGSQRWYVVHAAPNAVAIPQVHSLDAYTYQEILKSNRTVKHLGAVSIRSGVLSEDQASVSLRTYAVSPSLLAATHVAPQLGRIFTDAESYAEGAAVAILGFDAWRTYFASDPNVVGKQTRINGKTVQVVGVMPRGFSLGMLADLWLPLERTVITADTKTATAVEPFIALEPGQTEDAALREMKAAVDRVNQEYSQRFSAQRHVVLAHAHRAFTETGKALPAMLALLAVAVALLGSVNIGMMLFARLMERARELALRNSLGASRGRLLRQCLLESSVVVLVGLVLGIALAYFGTSWAQGFFERVTVGQPYVNSAEFTMHAHHLVIAIVAAVIIWLSSTLIPAWRITRQDAAMVLAGSKAAGSRGSSRSATILVGLQIMISCMVLVTSSNAVLVLYSMENTPSGFDTQRIVVSSVPTTFDTAHASAAQRSQYFDALATEIAGKIRGAEVGFAAEVPGMDSSTARVAIEARDEDVRNIPPARLASVSENYFQMMGISLRSGRWFDSTDNDTALDVAVLDENFARRNWPGQDPIGRRLRLNPAENGPWLTVVGVVSHVGLGTDQQSFRGKIYRPLRQSPPSEFVVIAKLPPESSPGAAGTRAALAAAAFAVDRDLPLNRVQAMDTFFEERNGGLTAIFGVIAAVTVFLAATGLFGLISRSVVLRTREVGVRRAVGSSQWQVTALFLRQGLVHLVVGVVLGGFLGIVATTRLGSVWPGILNNVVVVGLAVFVILAVVILTASYLPTRRAVVMEPGDALRYE